jgi:phosphate-selective porin OprO and OprP
MMRSAGVVLAVLTMSLMTTKAASAQTASSQPVTAGWQDGFVLQSADGENRLVLGLTVQADGRFLFDDTQTVADTFTIRKLRPTLSGRIAKYFEFRAMPDFGAGVATLQDAYFDIRFSPMFRVRAGRDKTPIGYELLLGDPTLLFPERSLASNLVPNRDVGVQAQGDLSSRLTYSAGVFNGVPDSSNSSTDVDTNGSKDFAGRIVWQPFRSADVPSSSLKGLGFHLGGSIGDEEGALPTYRTGSTQPYFSYAGDVTASGSHHRFTPAAFYYYKAFGSFAEYVRSTQNVARSGSVFEIGNQGWNVTGSYVLTGETASDRGVHPRHNFDPSNGEWGALQVVARYSASRVDPEVFANGLASSTSNQKADAVAVAANWYPNPYVKYYMTYERTSLEGGAPARHENLLLFRAQVAF